MSRHGFGPKISIQWFLITNVSIRQMIQGAQICGMGDIVWYIIACQSLRQGHDAFVSRLNVVSGKHVTFHGSIPCLSGQFVGLVSSGLLVQYINGFMVKIHARCRQQTFECGRFPQPMFHKLQGSRIEEQ
eukprot:scaffold4286_cov92-Amphora_coffeaeformis.AAC.2